MEPEAGVGVGRNASDEIASISFPLSLSPDGYLSMTPIMTPIVARALVRFHRRSLELRLAEGGSVSRAVDDFLAGLLPVFEGCPEVAAEVFAPLLAALDASGS
jgi:hypothetical protein